MKFILILLSIFFILINLSFSLDNCLGLTPPMGWDSFFSYGCSVNETHIISIIDYFKELNLSSLGYKYIILDDCWQGYRDSNGTLLPDPERFPNGIKPLADYVHSNGLLFGIYSDGGYKSCSGKPGSLGYEELDAQTFSEWGIDYLKYDNCFTDNTTPEERFTVMKKALDNLDKEIFFAMVEWGVSDPATWGKGIGNSWRTGGDISPTWDGIMKNIDENNKWAECAGPGHWNDPDMLIINEKYEKNLEKSLNKGELMTQFGLWAISKAPLIFSSDISKIENTKTIDYLFNEEVIAINQDPLGIQAKKIETEQPIPEINEFDSIEWREVDLVLEECKKSKSEYQKWIKKSDNSIRGKDEISCLDIPYCSNEPTLVRAIVCHLGSSHCRFSLDQQWEFQKDGTITSKLNKNYCLSVNDLKNHKVGVYTCKEAQNKIWEYNEDDQTLRNGDKCLSRSLGIEKLEVWSGPLSDGSVVVMMVNRGLNKDLMEVKWKDIGIPKGKALVRDLWEKKDIGEFEDVFQSYVYERFFKLLKITPIKNEE